MPFLSIFAHSSAKFSAKVCSLFVTVLMSSASAMPRKSKNKSKNKERSLVQERDLHDPDLYFNRELSWIEFNRRVLEEAEDSNHPLLERLKFISIFTSNLDEFFMIRVAGLKEQHSASVVNLSPDGMSAQEQLDEIRERLAPLIERQFNVLHSDIMPQLANHNLIIHPYSTLPNRDRLHLREYFTRNLLPLLTPLAVDPAHPFPHVLNRWLNVLFVIASPGEHTTDQHRYAVLQLPPGLSRFIPLERRHGHHFVMMGEIIQANADLLFPGFTIEESYTFRVIRDADIEIAEDEASDLLTEMEEQVRNRRWGSPVMLETEESLPAHLTSMLREILDLEDKDIYKVKGPLNLSDFMVLTDVNLRSLKFRPFATRPLQDFNTEGTSVFTAIRRQDLMVHHPFDSFSQNVVKFLDAAAADPKVMAIKLTLYRTGGDSPIIEALKRAAENGKQVIAFVELKARFDEQNNIIWARALEQAGVHVVYGIIGLKTHCKIAMVVRRDDDRIRTYLHLSTGNYNQKTARLYTDIGYFSAREDFEEDAINLFNLLTGYSENKEWRRLAVAPINLSSRVIEMIDREVKLHTSESPGEILIKINSLVDDKIIRALYRASQAGVKIRLVVRGICCLKPGIPGISENIEVRSVLGRFLEHTRILCFRNGGNEEYYLTSADLMPRNLYRRVEIMFPVLEDKRKAELRDILEVYWDDNVKSRRLLADGTYEYVKAAEGEKPMSAQQHFLNQLRRTMQRSSRAKRLLSN